VRAVAGEKTAFAYSDDISEAALLDAAATVRTIACGRPEPARQDRRRAEESPAAACSTADDPIATLDSRRSRAAGARRKLARLQDPRIKQ